MLINCVCCGPRDVSEYTYCGDATVVRPPLEPGSVAATAAGTAATADAWFAAVYQRRNPKGLHLELWQHGAGCRAFLRVARDTATHEISSVELMGPFASAGAKAG